MKAPGGRKRGKSGHHLQGKGSSDVWLTPPSLIGALGAFDLDPCAAPEPRPWPTAARMISLPEDGLTAKWNGLVWLNPPFSSWPDWVQRLSNHDAGGVALLHARTETVDFQSLVFAKARALFFLSGRLYYYTAAGERAPFNSGAPSVLVAYGGEAQSRLSLLRLPGAYAECQHVSGDPKW